MKKKETRQYFKDDDFLIGLGNKIRECRTAKRISIETLANKCEMPYSQLARMETGKVNFSVSFLSKLAKVLNLKTKDLMPDDI